jgi:hypothetical protein
MTKDPSMYCPCGRIAAWKSTTDVLECWEVIHINDPDVWKTKIPDDQKPRHKEIE